MKSRSILRPAKLASIMLATLLLAGVALAQSGWPRTFTNADGSTTTINSQPQRVLSTSVSVTGTLLAIEAPVVGSGSAGNGTYFAQWAAVANERAVNNVWPAGAVDLEAAYAVEPDLIVVSTSGADSAMDQLAEFRQIAPTIVVDYGGQTWQELAAKLGEALGTEAKVAEVVGDFDAYLAEAKVRIHAPAGNANIIAYNGAGTTNQIARAVGPHAQLLASVGFVLEDPALEWHTQAGVRNDFVWAEFERLTELTAETTFLLRLASDDVAAFLAEPVLANMPSVKAGQVYGLGVNSFRIDYYSATEIVDGLIALFGN